MPNRLTFGSEKDKLRTVVDNGVDVSDPRVMTRTNEAIQAILGFQHPTTGEPIVPVNGMMIAIIRVTNDEFFLPPEMEAVYHLEIRDTPAPDIVDGFYNIVNPFTYVDPSMSYDNPFIDSFYARPTDTNKFQRWMFFPNFGTGTILVIGPKAYVPITSDADELIVQNVPAIKKMILSIEYGENNQVEASDKYYDKCREMIIGEIKKHQMDPRAVMIRKGNYERDLQTFAQGSMAWTRARLALEVPGAMMVGKEDIRRVIDRAQLRMIGMMAAKGTLKEFNATITDGFIYCPTEVEAIIAASLDGQTMDIRSIFYKYISMGGCGGTCCCGCSGGRLEDAGEVMIAGQRRRKYRAYVGTEGSPVDMVCKLRWVPKEPNEQLIITNLEANRLMAREILAEDAGDWAEAAAVEAAVKRIWTRN